MLSLQCGGTEDGLLVAGGKSAQGLSGGSWPS